MALTKLPRYFWKICLGVCLVILPSSQTKAVSAISNDFVNILEIAPEIHVDMMYASSDNFLGRPVAGYGANICYLRMQAAVALKNANERLKLRADAVGKNLALLVRDCYRPEKAVRDFVQWVQSDSHAEMKATFYPDLSKADLIRLNYISPNSGHARGSSIDLTIVEVGRDGSDKELPMGTKLDFFGERAHTLFPGLNQAEQANRALLLEIMQPEFKNYPKEWWHFVLQEEPLPNKSYDFDIVAADEVVTQVTQPNILGALDTGTRGPLSLVTLFKMIHAQNNIPLPQLGSNASSSGATLAKFAETYGRFANIMSADLARIVASAGIDWEKDITKTYRPESAQSERGKKLRLNGNVMRVFNEKWLSSGDGKFILAGVVNRIDRKDFDPSYCGELRFIYRLGYEMTMGGQIYASRLPFTVNMVFRYSHDGNNCRDVASLWRAESVLNAEGLLKSPLDFSKLQFKQMEINAQIARFPSDLENDEHRHFAGQAIYWMRIFAVSAGHMEPQKLENTPDVASILKDERKQQLLKSFIATHLPQIDSGVFLLPGELLTDLALTYSTLGSARVANKPFDLLVSAGQAQAIVDQAEPGQDFRFIGSGSAILERLNTSSCMGCHQSASTAGFHFLGEDRFDFGTNPGTMKEVLDGNRLQLPFSPHFSAELPRRKAYLERLVRGELPNQYRPHPSAVQADWVAPSVQFQLAQANMPCLIGTGGLASPSIWSCSEGLSCTALVHNDSLMGLLGQCVPPAKMIYSGLSCRKNEIEDHTRPTTTASSGLVQNPIAYNLFSFQDRMTRDDQIYGLPEGKLNVSALNCRPTRIGVPLGRITRACAPSEMSLESLVQEKNPKEICAIVGGKGFEEMAKGYFDSRKFAAGVSRGMLNTCGPRQNCREDYICQEMPDFLVNERFQVKSKTLAKLHDRDIGFCTPTYFLYQLRLDGHPNPR